MSHPLSFESTSEILQAIRIPAAPAVFMELHELMQRDEPEIDEVAAVISRDMGLAALVLKTVNSPFFGLRAPAKSIRHATTLLGLLNVSNIVAGLALRRAMETAGGPAPEHFWESPVNVGMVAAKLTQWFSGVMPDEAYMLGLFHDVGVPLMMERFADYAVRLGPGRCAGPPVTACEDAAFRTNHAVVGYLVSRSWGLPGHIGELILRHHDVPALLNENGGALSRNGMLLAVLKMAEHIDQRYWGKRDDPEWQYHGEAVLAYAGVSSTDFEDIVSEMLDLLSTE
ncbi:MAG: HDOD domain-containing protein [Gammaproteobacteria bacterium]|nr:HDOD domain-containing protein [Gammaproteobacteria bacterium]